MIHKGVIKKNIVPSSMEIPPFNNIKTPVPNTPANPVPEDIYPITSLGNPLENPIIVISPNEH